MSVNKASGKKKRGQLGGAAKEGRAGAQEQELGGARLGAPNGGEGGDGAGHGQGSAGGLRADGLGGASGSAAGLDDGGLPFGGPGGAGLGAAGSDGDGPDGAPAPAPKPAPARLITAGDLGFTADEAGIARTSYSGVVSLSGGASGFAGLDGIGDEAALAAAASAAAGAGSFGAGGDGFGGQGWQAGAGAAGGSQTAGYQAAGQASAPGAPAAAQDAPAGGGFRGWLSRNKFVLLSYFSVFAIVLAVYIVNGIYPFGEKTIVKSDMAHSYVPTMIELRRILFEGHSLYYSWNGGLGLNFIHNLSQMAVSPFVALTFLFPVKDVTEGIALLLLLKIPFAAVTLNLYVRNRFKLKDVAVVLISIVYALSAYVTANHFNTMWFEGVILLPLIAMGIERLVKDRKSLMYMLALSAAIFTNYLIGFYLCGFSLLYFIANLFFRKQWGDKKELRRSLLLFLTRSLLAAGLVGFFIIPIALTLQGTGYISTSFPTGLKINFPVLKLISSHFWGMYPSILTFSSVSGPNIYCGMLTIVLLPLFYFNRNIKVKEKLLFSGLCLFIIAGFIVNLVDFVYNGFRFTSMFPHRFSFIYSFLLIVMAVRAFLNLDKKRLYVLFFSAPAFAALVVANFRLYPQRLNPDKVAGVDYTPILEIMPGVQKPGAIAPDVLIVNIALIAVFSALVFVYAKFRDRRPMLARALAISMAVVTVAEISTSATRNMGVMDELERDVYMQYYDAMQDVSKLLADESAFYRATFKHNLSLSDARLYNYKDLSTFSALQSSVTELGSRVGLTSTLNSMLAMNPTPLVSSVLSVKYLMDKAKPLPKSFTIYDYREDMSKIYDKSDDRSSVYVHENPFVLPVGFLVNSEVWNWNIEASENVYEVQNDFARKAAGIDGTVMVPIYLDREPEYEYLDLTPVEEEFQKYTVDITEDPATGHIPTITLHFTADKEGYMNIHIRTSSSTSGRVYVTRSGSTEEEYILNQTTGNLQGVLDAGMVYVGDEIRVVMNMDRKRLDTDDLDAFVPFSQFDLNAAIMDQPVFEEVIERFRQSPLNVTYYDDTTIRGTISADRDGMLFTSVASDGGWTIVVDGKEREGVKIGTALVGVRLEAGEHEVELKYGLNGMWPGLLVSFACVALVLLLFLLPYLRRRGAAGA
ncbi:MAG: YfhO family protein, partial [Clostridiales bacterium]|nr:YfhO family protein [Clostridiales bacterium]